MSHKLQPAPAANALLGRLGLAPAELEVRREERGRMIWEHDSLIERVAFPLSGMVSLVMVQVPGWMAQVDLDRPRPMADANPQVAVLLGCWREVLLRLVMQGAACSALHDTPERAARWIAMTRDRSGADELPLTQGLLAEMLGVNRPTITLAAQDLDGRGLIEDRRGTIRVLDREALERASCDGPLASQAAYRELLGHPGPRLP